MVIKEQILLFCKEQGVEPYELIPHIEESEQWINTQKKFCDRYDFNPRYLAESINDPKVIPMIRGKAFEFTAPMLMLGEALVFFLVRPSLPE